MSVRFLISVVLSMLIVASAGYARRSKPQPAEGTVFVAAFTPTDVREADGNTFVEGIATGTFTGTFTGSFAEHLTEIIHPSGDINFHGEIVFTGTVDDCGSGTVLLRDEGTGIGAGAFSEAKVVTVDQGASSVDVHANLDINFAGFRGAYTGTFQCHDRTRLN